ncbi:Ubiquitin-protein ligase E3A [Auxenochlorella protothecoides]|uniref:Ubiquitin-protein ligase E3A n=1 Tax=Auxenochlorella protothecoides TaxID=3075 RepID=A0A087STU0_AUXPR|nr:Ubiquitin-protein ligase E3A [Auxenochlorella protothecoides]KFM29144.1 Ubiquitin-protein ligase E3A [Auxenochlorella protothecoides]
MGASHTAAVTGQGEVYTWGLNDCAQLGMSSGRGPTVDTPRRMELLVGWNVRGMACGAAHTVAFTMQDVITWGANDRGQCGHGERAEPDWVKPRSIKMLHDLMITQVVCGAAHTLCVTGTSQVYAWGANSRGQLGLGDVADRRTPTLVDGLWALPVLQLGAGDSHSAALTNNGFLFTWGANCQGQLGLPAAAEVAAAAAMHRSASERRRVNRRVNQRFLTAMLEMEIPQDRAELALHETGNVGVEVAAEWLFSVPDDVLETHLAADPGTPVEELGEAHPDRDVLRLEAAVAAARDAPREEHDARVKPIAIAVERIFGSPAAICAAFGLRDRVGLDAALLDSVLLSELERNSRLLGTPERAQVLLAACQSLLLGDPRCSQSLVPRLCGVVLAAPATTRHLLVKWWAECPAALLEARVVRPLQRYLTDELYTTKKLTVSVMNVIKVLARVEEGSAAGRVLPPDAFYNELISEKLDVLDHYEVFCQSFVVEVAGWGERRAVELKPGGAGIPVTEDSRREFVDAYVDFWLNTSVHAQFEAFARGFLMLCGGPALQLFSATELERLVCGNPCLDFEGLQRSARYEGGYSADHRVVQWLWDVVGELDADERRLFLKFFTGSDRAPIGGLANLRCVIQRDGADSNKLPTSHTCFNTLLLPSYRSREKLADRLKLAILNSEGFGLE